MKQFVFCIDASAAQLTQYETYELIEERNLTYVLKIGERKFSGFHKSHFVVLNDDVAKKMMNAASKVFGGEPVRKVSDYCKSFYLWQDAINARHNELHQRKENGEEVQDSEFPQGEDFADELTHVMMCLQKSALLLRLVYNGEPLRTEKCPIHKGQWSGCDDRADCFSEEYPQGCMSGSNITGWLPLPETNERYKEFHRKKNESL